MPQTQKISGLMSVYHGTDAAELDLCLESIAAQTLPPDELVVVLDGPVRDAVRDTLRRFKNITTIPLQENRGLAIALNAGLEKCRHPLIARFDADDIFPPERLRLQADYMAAHSEVAILGGRIAEFEKAPGDKKTKNIREVPPAPRADFYTATRNPMNHMTVMFRRDAIRAIGGYRAIHLMEDYALWLRALAAGLRLANLPDILAHARIGHETGGGMHARRRGLALIKGEWAIFLAKLGAFRLYWWPIVAVVSVLRMTARLLPTTALKAVYERCLRG